MKAFLESSRRLSFVQVCGELTLKKVTHEIKFCIRKLLDILELVRTLTCWEMLEPGELDLSLVDTLDSGMDQMVGLLTIAMWALRSYPSKSESFPSSSFL